MMNNKSNQQPDPLYVRARQILQAQPEIGKARLAALLGVKTPTSRRLRERWWGETQGHSTHPNYVRVQQLKQTHPDLGAVKVAQALGLTLDHAKVHLARWIGAQNYAGAIPAPAVAATTETSELPPTHDNELQDNMHDGERDLTYRGTRIQTLADLLVYAQVDTTIWEVERHVINKYEVAAKTPEGMTTSMLFQIKAWLRRKMTEEKLQNLMQGILEQFRQAAPIQPPIIHRAGPKGLLEISIMDHHFGKYCSELETGRAYDHEISERMFILALEDLLAKSASLPAEKILFVCGNDFLNTDHLGRTTTAGTPQDEAIRYQESFLRGRQLLVRAIDRLRQIAPVQVVMVTGNHDTHAFEGTIQVLVVEDDHIWQSLQRCFQVCQGSRETCHEFFHRHVVASLRHAHGDALIGDSRTGNANETEHHLVACLHRVFKKRQLVAHRIRKNRFKHKAFALLQQTLPQHTRHFRRSIRIQPQFPCQDVCIDQP
jgi:hypothetical protein